MNIGGDLLDCCAKQYFGCVPVFQRPCVAKILLGATTQKAIMYNLRTLCQIQNRLICYCFDDHREDTVLLVNSQRVNGVENDR
jgi:hypothetical protein